jgi:hypothetical protein
VGESLPVKQIVFDLAFNEVPMLEAELPIAEVSADLKTWQSVYLKRQGLSMILDRKSIEPIRYVRSKWIPDRVAEIHIYGENGSASNGLAFKPKDLKLSWLFPKYKDPQKTWSLPFTLDEVVSGSYLAVACNGKHGVEGAYVALRVGDQIVGASSRAPSFPVNPLENGVGKAEKNCSYFIPLTADMVGKKCEVVVLGLDPKALDFTPDVWLTAYPIPNAERMMTLERER